MAILKDRKEWRQLFIVDIKDKLRASKEEYDEYMSTKEVVLMQQAGNKMFSLVENYLEVKYNYRIRSYNQLKMFLETRNQDDANLLKKCEFLHTFFYTNELNDMAESYAVIYKEVYDVMKSRVDKLSYDKNVFQ